MRDYRAVKEPWIVPYEERPDIERELRGIYDGYALMENQKLGRIELHDLHPLGGFSFCLVCDTPVDSRIVDKAKRTYIAYRSHSLALDLDEHNRLVDEQNKREFDGELDAIRNETEGSLGYAMENDGLEVTRFHQVV
jgi:hypothetical protein